MDRIKQLNTIKVLTIQQPWAWLIAKGIKDVENRTWATNYRGPIAIHVSKKSPDMALDMVNAIAKIQRVPDIEELPDLAKLKAQEGQIIAIADLANITRNSSSPWAIDGQNHWHLTNVREVEPIACKGKLGLWDYHYQNLEIVNEIEFVHPININLDDLNWTQTDLEYAFGDDFLKSYKGYEVRLIIPNGGILGASIISPDRSMAWQFSSEWANFEGKLGGDLFYADDWHYQVCCRIIDEHLIIK